MYIAHFEGEFEMIMHVAFDIFHRLTVFSSVRTKVPVLCISNEYTTFKP